MRRTLIALPHDRCVHVDVNQRDQPLALRVGAACSWASTSSGSRARRSSASWRRADYATPRRRPGPTLEIDFTSMGGELVVRDYPDDVDPTHQPDWPGYPVFVEERPDTTGLAAQGGEADGARVARAPQGRRSATSAGSTS